MDDRLTLRPTPWLHARGGFLSPPSTTAWARGLSMSMITNVCVQNRVQKNTHLPSLGTNDCLSSSELLALNRCRLRGEAPVAGKDQRGWL